MCRILRAELGSAYEEERLYSMTTTKNEKRTNQDQAKTVMLSSRLPITYLRSSLDPSKRINPIVNKRYDSSTSDFIRMIAIEICFC